MIPKVIVIILLTTSVVTSMELHPVKQCPNDEEWYERAHMLCDNNEYRYHCMFSVHCTLVESCIEPQSGSYKYSQTEYGVYFLAYNNETGSTEFYKEKPFKIPLVHNLMTNSSSYWDFLNIAYCKKVKAILSRTENHTKISREDNSENQTKISCEDCPGNYNVVLAVAIISCGLAICFLVVCVTVSVLFYKNRKKDSNDRNRTSDPSLTEGGDLMEETNA